MCVVLTEAGCIEIVRRSANDNASPFFKLSCPLDEIRAVAARNSSVGPSFEELLAAFIGVLGHFGGLSTESGREFSATSALKPAFDALASLEYITQSGNGYSWTWTSKIEPAMKANHFWPEAYSNDRAQAKKAIDRLSVAARAEIDQFAQGNQKINAIRAFRHATGARYKEAKLAVEEIMFPELWSSET